MKIKKSFNLICEILVDENQTWQCVLRNTQGQPIEVCETPSAVLSSLSELSKDNEPGQSAD